MQKWGQTQLLSYQAIMLRRDEVNIRLDWIGREQRRPQTQADGSLISANF